MNASETVPPYLTSRMRLAVLLCGYVCVAAISFVLGRPHGLWITFGLLAVWMLCWYFAHGSLRARRPTGLQHLPFVFGVVSIVVLAGAFDYETIARKSSWLPLNPVFLFIACFHATVDLLRLKARDI